MLTTNREAVRASKRAITPAAIQQEANAMVKSGLRSSTIRGYLAVLSEVLGLAVVDGLIPTSPAQKIHLPPDPVTIHLRLQPWEVRQLVEESPEPFRTFFLLTFILGLRPGEAKGMTPQNIRGGALHVSQQLSHADGLKKSLKTRQSHRVIHLPPEVEAAVRQGSGTLRLVQPPGKQPHTAKGFDTAFRKVFADAWPGLAPHTGRRTCATMISADHLTSDAVRRKILGHIAPDVHGRYIDPDGVEVEAAILRLWRRVSTAEAPE